MPKIDPAAMSASAPLSLGFGSKVNHSHPNQSDSFAELDEIEPLELLDPSLVAVHVPTGAQPGSCFRVRLPNTGKLVAVRVPQGARPGSILQISSKIYN